MSSKFKIFLFLLLLPLGYLSAQTDMPECITPPSCNNLSLEMVRVNDISNDCAPQSPAGDQFRQLFYKVYLRYGTSTGALTPGTKYALSYTQLNVGAHLSGAVRSAINIADSEAHSTQSNGGYWSSFTSLNGDIPKLELTSTTALMTFANLVANTTSPCGTGTATSGNQIIFDFSAPPPFGVSTPPPTSLMRYGYVELFTLVVDAYPGEMLSLAPQMENAWVNGTDYCALPVPQSGISTDTYAPFDVGVTSPAIPLSGTQNSDIGLRFGTPTTSAQGQQEVPLVVRNGGATTLTAGYLEFVVKVSTQNLPEPFTFDLATPEVTEENGSRFLHYKIEGAITLPPGAITTVAIIRLGPPTIGNLGWSAKLYYPIDEAEKFRVQTSDGTTEACTNIQSDGTPLVIDVPGTEICDDYPVTFSTEVFGPGPHDPCNKYTLRVGLRHPSLLNISAIQFNFSIPNSDIANPTVIMDEAVDFHHWPTLNYADYTFCGQPGEFTITNGKTSFNYCFDGIGTSSTQFFGTTGYQYIDIPVFIKGADCFNGVILSQLSISYMNGSTELTCSPMTEPPIGFPQCGKGISGRLATEVGAGVEDASVTLSYSNCSTNCNLNSFFEFTPGSGYYGFCDLCEGCTYTVTPLLDQDPLNGVNTWDLVLISRNILGLEPLNSPYKLISADANKSGTVTTYDIVEFRKLILGSYNLLPANTSWRFIDADQMFTDNANPFAQTLFENIIIENGALPNNYADFVACKIGDVDLSSSPNNRPTPLPETYLSWDMAPAKSAKTFTVPVVYSGETAVTALQFGLQFNPALMTLVGPTAGDVPGLNDSFFGLDKTDDGLIRFSWNAMDLDQTPVAPGSVLFYLTFERTANAALRDAEPVLTLDESFLAANAWLADGTPYQLVKSTAVSERKTVDTPASVLNASVHPNPTAGLATLQLTSPEAGKMRLTLMNAYGQRVALRDVSVVKGTQTVPLNEAANLPAGIYQWWIRTPDGSSAQGQLVIK